MSDSQAEEGPSDSNFEEDFLIAEHNDQFPISDMGDFWDHYLGPS